MFEANLGVTCINLYIMYMYMYESLLDKFFSSGYYRGNRQLGRDLNITFHSVTYTPSSGNLTLNREYSTKDDIYWLNCKYSCL